VFATEAGDLRAERESWFLVQKGEKVTGRYRRTLTRVSMDGRVFGCNGAPRYTLVAEFRIEGRVKGDYVRLFEKSFRVKNNPCETGRRRLDSYLGRTDGKRLVLVWSTGQQVLKRRDITGVWTWSRHRLTRGGDTEVTSERWYLRQKGPVVEGVRQRSDLHVSNDKKRYRCNSQLRMSRFVRWGVQGKLDGPTVSLTFGSPLVKPTPCEQRRLKYTRGMLELSHEPDRIQAVLPEGRFVLERQVGAVPGGGTTRRRGTRPGVKRKGGSF